MSAGGPFGIWRKSYGERFPTEPICERLAEVGVTEVIYFDQNGRGGPVNRPTEVPHVRCEPRAGNRDFLKELLESAGKRGIKVWLAYTPPGGKYPGTDIYGLNDPRMIALYSGIIDEVGRRYGDHENLMGVHWHEVDCSETVDQHEDDLAEFSQFCKSRFGEAYTGKTMPEVDPADKWWRRFCLYRIHVVTQFVAKTKETADRHGLKTSFCYYTPEAYGGEGWRWGYDVVELEKLCHNQWFTGYAVEFGKPYQTIRGAWIDFGISYRGQNLARNYSTTFHGRVNWFFEHRSPLFLEEIRKYYSSHKRFDSKYGDFYLGFKGHTEKEVDLFLGPKNVKNWIGLMKAWQEGASPARVAVAVNPTTYVMKYPRAAGIEYGKTVRPLMESLTGITDVDGIVLGSRFSLDAKNLRRYDLIVIPQDMGEGLSAETVQSLKGYLELGGRLFVVATPIVQSRRDLTQPEDLTREWCGVEIVGDALAGYIRIAHSELTPPGGKKLWAAGRKEVLLKGARVLATESITNAPLLVRKDNVDFATIGYTPEFGEYLASTACASLDLPVRLSDNRGLRILEGVQKDGALCVALWGKGEARLRVDAEVLGLKGDRFQVKDIVTGVVIGEPRSDALRKGIIVDIKYTNQPLVVAIGAPKRLEGFRGIYPSAEVFKGMTVSHTIENPEVPIMIPDKPGIKVGVYHGGLGATPIIEALGANKHINAYSLPRFDARGLSRSDVVIIPQAGSRAFFNRAVKLIREWVNDGGRVLLLHDAVGHRGHKPLFPEIGKGETHPRFFDAKVALEHPVTAGFLAGDKVRHAYLDHIVVKPGPDGKVLLKNPAGDPVVVVGAFGKGRVVLNGMATGYASNGPDDVRGREKPPEGDELRILVNSVKWLAE